MGRKGLQGHANSPSMCVCARARACVRACVRAGVCVCMCVRAFVRAGWGGWVWVCTYAKVNAVDFYGGLNQSLMSRTTGGGVGATGLTLSRLPV